jgi:uncharacterized membrane protein YfcA
VRSPRARSSLVGGGSILAAPLLSYVVGEYVVGEPNPHIAIRASAIAVAVNVAPACFGGLKERLTRAA